jgi:hypothetical protein
MAVAGIKLQLDSKEIAGLRDSLRNLFAPKEVAPILGEALEKAIWPAFLRLREVTPVGPTGNLKRAVNHKVRVYGKDGGAVGLIGYNRSGKGEAQEITPGGVQLGPDRAFHQWWLEFGTKQREVPSGRNPTGGPKERQYQRRSPTAPYQRARRRNGRLIIETVQGSGVLHEVRERVPTYIASSLSGTGPFKIMRKSDGGVSTDNPHAFFKKSNRPIVIPRMQPGGTEGQPPVETAWRQSQRQVAFILQQELRISLERALSSLNYSGTGTVIGTP